MCIVSYDIVSYQEPEEPQRLAQGLPRPPARPNTNDNDTNGNTTNSNDDNNKTNNTNINSHGDNSNNSSKSGRRRGRSWPRRLGRGDKPGGY